MQAAFTSAASPHLNLSRNHSFYPLSQPTHATLLLWPLASNRAIASDRSSHSLSNCRKRRRPLLLCFSLPQSVRSCSQPPAILAYSGHQPSLPPAANPCLLLFPCRCCLLALNRVTVAHSSSPSCNRRLQPSSLAAAVASNRTLLIFPLPQSHLPQPPLSQPCPTVASSHSHPSSDPAACRTLLLSLPLPHRIRCSPELVALLVVSISSKNEHRHYLFFNCCLICCHSRFQSRYLPLQQPLPFPYDANSCP
ncbi:hypothetical protein B296_00006114 [Ensete ventricosum]|uniref:Uncharacterized protein n=1 Tax=Ensete ventricosum TaxID=4639 RepID=A0A426ZQX4_ENSVE|nr:hypothetical protein B296_00006114 [Ensete ventricosum]